MLVVVDYIFGIEPTNIDPFDYRVVGCLRPKLAVKEETHRACRRTQAYIAAALRGRYPVAGALPVG
ncbi:unnamed protein product [Clonostachys chloroleuca]|uniref:Uncharacterized protein n=1 Tax=Clonostachys chloroleuca TaxID=1926264 RepID=A0AA35Q7Z5_9HYPO|nr:unnamed protein product [Clonostachys chloroleuca]